MAYNPYKLAYPDIARTRQQVIDEIRYNLLALRDIIAATGTLPGWDYFARNGSGTAAQPQYMYFKRSTYCVELTLVWGTTGGEAGNVTKVTFKYATNETHASFTTPPVTATNGTYDNLADEAGDFVVTITYDSSSNVTRTNWGVS